MAFGGIVGKQTTTYTDEQIQQLVIQGAPFVWSKVAGDTVQMSNGSDGTLQITTFANFSYTINPEDIFIYKKLIGNLRLRVQTPESFQSAQIVFLTLDFDVWNNTVTQFGRINTQATKDIGDNYYNFEVNSTGIIYKIWSLNNWSMSGNMPYLQKQFYTVNESLENYGQIFQNNVSDYFSLSNPNSDNKFICDPSNSNLTYEVWKCSINLPT